jgi:hypothetical protein
VASHLLNGAELKFPTGRKRCGNSNQNENTKRLAYLNSGNIAAQQQYSYEKNICG